MEDEENEPSVTGPDPMAQTIAKAVKDYKKKLEGLTGYPIKIKNEKYLDSNGLLQSAWLHSGGFHLMQIGGGFKKQLLEYVKCHELTHLEMEFEARGAGTYRRFDLSSENSDVSLRRLTAGFRELFPIELTSEQIICTAFEDTRTLLLHMYDLALDMVVESRMFNAFPVLRFQQYCYLQNEISQYADFHTDPNCNGGMPHWMKEKYSVLTCAHALFADNLPQGKSQLAMPYMDTPTYDQSQRLWTRWKEKSEGFRPGDEYELVDEIATILDLRDWYTWDTSVQLPTR